MPPPRKRRVVSSDAGRRQASTAQDGSSTTSPPLDIPSLYERLVVRHQEAPHDRVTPRLVWRQLVAVAAEDKAGGAAGGPSSSQRRQDSYRWMQTCEVLAAVVTSHPDPRAAMQSLLDAMEHDNNDDDKNDNNNPQTPHDPSIHTRCWATILAHPRHSSDDDENAGYWRSLSRVLRFGGLVATALHQEDEALAFHTGATLRLWEWMPPRRRDLELRLRNGWNEEYERLVGHAGNQATNSLPPLVVVAVEQVLRLLRGHHLQPQDVPMEPNNDRGDDEDDDEDPAKARAERHLHQWIFVHRALDFLLDLMATPHNIYLVLYLQSIHFVLHCRHVLGRSTFSQAEGHLFLAQQLLERLQQRIQQYSGATDATTSVVRTAEQRLALSHARATRLQQLCHRYYANAVPDLVYAAVGLLVQPLPFLRNALGGLSDAQLLDLLHRLRLVDATTGQEEVYRRSFLVEVLEEYIGVPDDPVRELSSYPLYPTEKILWDWTKIPPSLGSLLPPSGVLSLPKLASAKFLSFLDYLGRTLELTRLETAYEIRADLVDAIRRLRPVVRQTMVEDEDSNVSMKLVTEFTGWARMALELVRVEANSTVKIVKVAKPLLGQRYPEQVVAEIAIDLKQCGESLRREWDELGEHDVIFLVSVDASKMSGLPAPLLSEYHLRHGSHLRWENDKDRRIPDEDDATFPKRFGITLVRGCMILQVKDEQGNVISEPGSEHPVGTRRVFRVAMDPSQFAHDKTLPSGTALYESFNLVVRRKGAENNFKAVLETIRSLMIGIGSIDRVVPSWLQRVILGQGDPTAASYRSKTMKEYAKETVGVAFEGAALDFGDTFVSESHLRNSFHGYHMIIDENDEQKELETPTIRRNYRIRFPDKEGDKNILVESYAHPNTCAGNSVPFTPVQVDAIRSGLSVGLSVIVGPPGTGKTDVAVQIIASLYHSFPTQRTLIITHSNAALNDIFQKVTARGDVNERYLIRLGAGERDLQVDSTHDFTKAGRVAHSLHRRSLLLEEVQQLSESLGLSGRAERGADGSPSYTCETAAYFYENHIMRRIRAFKNYVTKSGEPNVKPIFPFNSYFKPETETLSLDDAERYFVRLKLIFDELAEYRPLELLRNQRQRTDYLLLHQARIVAMTCTHAAIARSHLIELGFEYDNVIVEEAGQMTEIETFIPLLLQKGESGEPSGRLKRVCLMGDHNQLPPVIKNMTFASYSSLDQSMFARLVKLGVSHIQLDKQGRSRPEIASLYKWRYKELGNLPQVSEGEEYRTANAGFVHTFQVIDVPDFQGQGESAPTPYFFQNTGEAEYAVALFQYMVLIGHPPESISILATYNGQKELISDILARRCGPGTPLDGIRPRAVSTVDQYQGQQNNFVILSLVRTQKVGHIRDVRRLVVAVSRARLGLYVLCRQSLFASHYDLKRVFDKFADKPLKLQLLPGEVYPTKRTLEEEVEVGSTYQVDDAVDLGNVVYQMQEDLVKNLAEQDQD